MKKQPFCWQEKKILRLLRYNYNGAELQKLRNLYLILTEIYSDFNGQDIKYYTETIAKYSGLSKAWIPKGLKIFEKLKVILLAEDKVGGKFKGKKLIFTPENLEKINIKTVAEETINGKIITGETVSGKTITGKTVAEETINGKIITGETVSGKTITGKTVAEETINGKIITGKTVTEETVSGKTVNGKTIYGKSVDGFLKTSEGILLLEDNKRIEDIKNTHIGEDKKVDDNLQQEEEFEKDKLSDTSMEIQDILKKYRDLELPDFKYPPENYIILRVYRDLGIAKLYEALTLMSKSEFVKNNTPEA
ncbi:hypothetical protein [Fusobacterium varium]|uniref:hypothetical protein n=1 Tax=Fusobacterium varium TaxID=856 RepID=UPI003565331E